MKYNKVLLFMAALLCLAFHACAQPVSDSQINTMGSSGDYLSPNTSSGGYYPNTSNGQITVTPAVRQQQQAPTE